MSSAIGVFDSGIGGLTVLHALQDALPRERFIYLGDTARLPYGTKSAATVERYALRAAEHLVNADIKALVVACNTASAVALTALQQRFASLPVFGVVEPGAEAAVRASRSGHIAVIGTESTVRGGAYQRAILARRTDARVRARACSLLVSLAEEGWFEGEVVEAILRQYLGAWIGTSASGPDCLVLGCTHFPLLTKSLRRVLGESVAMVDSAATTAAAVREALTGLELLQTEGSGGRHLTATDDAGRFARVGSAFLGEAVRPEDVEVVDI